MNLINWKSVLGLCAGAAMMAGMSAPASAQSLQAQCDSFARQQAAPFANAGGTVGGALLGAGAGAVIGGILDGGKGAGRGAIIGGATGAVGGTVGQNRRWNRAYQNAYNDCIAVNSRQRVRQPVVRQQPAVRRTRGRPEPWTDAWYRYCASKYRSFNANTGTFTTYGGQKKLCR